MNVKKSLNLLKSNKAKTVMLAGLMGLMPSCKMETNEPDTPKGKPSSYIIQNDTTNIPEMPVDSFMKHMPNVDNAVFYEPTEDTHCFLFHTNPSTQDVTDITELRDMRDRDRSIQNPYHLTRLDNTCVNGSANFITDSYWVYEVRYTNEYGGGNWMIDCVTQSEYDTKYQNMSDSAMAELASSRILSKYPGDTYHAEQIKNSILNGNGHWEHEDPFYVTFNSKGAQHNLKYSDFGTFDASTLDRSEGFTSMYSGGLPSNEIDKSFVQPMTIKMTAFGNVKYDGRNGSDSLMVVSTGRDSATFTIDAAQNETIVMPFNNWYKVTIIRTNNSVVSTFEDVNGNIDQIWQLPHPDTQETGYREGVQDNGLVAKDGTYGIEHQDGILTGTSVNYYTDETGYVEFVGQGYRQDWLPNKKIQFTFSVGGTSRPKDGGMTTGLENVYCAPARNNSKGHQR